MNAKLAEAIQRHGRALLAAFPNATEKEPVALCKKLRRVETAISRVTLQNCNVGVPDEEMDTACEKALARVRAIMGWTEADARRVGLFVNRDPRGYALKLEDTVWLKDWNRGAADRIHTDWGGYGILAPDLTV